jgi:insulysin
MSWWEKEYCAKRMKLVVIGKDSIETLEKWVKEKFEAVPIRTEGAPAVGPNGQRVVFEDSPTNPDRMGVSCFLEMRTLVLMIDGHLCQACEG